jgi:hypothetical protein
MKVQQGEVRIGQEAIENEPCKNAVMLIMTAPDSDSTPVFFKCGKAAFDM